MSIRQHSERQLRPHRRREPISVRQKRRPRRLLFEPLESRQLLTVVFNEIYYDHPDPSQRGEFIELFNTSNSSVDISNWTIDQGVDFVFPANTSIGARDYLVIGENSDDFESINGFRPFGEWEDGDKLSNGGERVELLNAAGAEVDELRYQVGFPWPTPESGQSIELVQPQLDNDEGGAWRAAGSSENAISEASAWTYRRGITNNPPSDWNTIGFDTASDNIAWQGGVAPIGYGDGDDTTILSDMRNNYTSVYFRKTFEHDGSPISQLQMRLYVDDGAIIYLNGVEVSRRYVSNGDKNFNNTANNHEAAWETIDLFAFRDLIQQGDNVLAVHGLNQAASSSDFSFDAELLTATGQRSPGQINGSFSTRVGPLIEDVEHFPTEPKSGDDVVITAEIDDVDGVAAATLEYQLVDPGNYIAIDDRRFVDQWTPVPLTDDGLGDDEVAGDGTFTATLPSELQTHRRLVRYRILASDGLGDSVQVPFAEDPTPNFAYFVYDGVPDWTGAVQPGVTPEQTFSSETLTSVPTYHLITTRSDHVNSQHIPGASSSSYSGSEYLWQGTLVYDGKVYDHIRYRARGGVWRYAMGKNMWKFDFNPGQDFYAKDDYGNEYDVGWDKLNLGANIQQGNFWHRGEQGLFESIGFRLFDMAGVEAPNTNYVQFRIIEDASETGATQYEGDFQGLYLAIEQLDGNFLEQHGLEDGNLYKMENGTGVGGIGGDLNNQGDYPAVTDSSDLIEFKETYESGTQSESWWQENLDLDSYYNYRSIVEAIHHYDIANGKNYFLYNNPETGKWQTVPWDLDLTWADNMFGSGNEPFKSRVLAHENLQRDYQNRLREIRDLLYNTEQVGKLIDEYAAIVDAPNTNSLAEADRAMWDYNPILESGLVNSSKAGEGLFYAGGSGVPATGTFRGMAQKMKNYVQTRGTWIDNNLLDDDDIPRTPTIGYSGQNGYPADGLQFTTNTYNSPNRTAFAAMEWRIGEVAHPGTEGFDATQRWVYEIDSVWESETLTQFQNTVQVDSSELTPGHTYRARVRVMDADGSWSHWSDAHEFVAGLPSGGELKITELNYHPDSDQVANENELEFIELFNDGAAPIDLTGFRIADFSDDGYTFPDGTMIQPDQYLVVARNPDVFAENYSSANLVSQGYAPANLSNGGESITVLNADGVQILSFTYDDKAPWPEGADGDGQTLERTNLSAPASLPSSWSDSVQPGGSPGRSNEALTSGDYDRNGTVDDADFALWKSSFNETVLNAGDGADGNLDGFIDTADFTVWRDARNLALATIDSAAQTSTLFASAANPFGDWASAEFVGPLEFHDWQATLVANARLDGSGSVTSAAEFNDPQNGSPRQIVPQNGAQVGAQATESAFHYPLFPANENDWWNDEEDDES